MRFQLKNEHLKIELSDLGAELQSIEKEGQEYLWQADEKYWPEHAPVLFPFVGRQTDGKFTVEGQEYHQEIHGFARHFSFDMVNKTESSIAFTLKDDEHTREMYPWHFELRISYMIEDNRIMITYRAENLSCETMYFGIGGHPGFCLPLEKNLKFEDYYLKFGGKCTPDRIGITDAGFLSGINSPYPLEGRCNLALRHDLFDHDAIVLQNMADQVTLKSDKSKRSVTVSYPDMPYLGIWHNSYTEAPFVAIEPWVSLPARQDIVEEFRYRPDYIRLKAGQVYTNQWSITVE